MLFTPATIDGIRAGRITLAFRRWQQVRVKPGSRITNARGVVEIVSVAKVDSVSDADAQAAGFDSADSLLALVDKKSRGGDLYRVGVRFGGEDPRKALRQNDELSDDERATIRQRLDRMDAKGAWTRAVLRSIGERPEVVSTELAAEVGMERPDFKLRVRRLKALGLTESLVVGYRLSPRGRAFLDGDEA